MTKDSDKVFPLSGNRAPDSCSEGKQDGHSATLIMPTELVIILILIRLFIDRSSIDKHAGVFPWKMCSDRRKTMVVDQKKTNRIH